MNGTEPYKPIAPRIESYNGMPTPLARPRPQASPGRFRKILKRSLLVIVIAIVLLVGFIGVRTYQITGKIFVGQSSSFTRRIAEFFNFGGGKLIGEDLGQINILLLGIGGQNHDGGYLADTIILAQVRPDLNKITLSAIPRDYLANLKGLGNRKINAAFAETWQTTRNWDEAGRAMREAVGDVAGVNVPYFAVVDFKGFELGVDKLGGVDIDIPRTFTDYTFPDNNEGYLPAVTFTQGHEHMSGERALIYARSRHAGGGEGSDFARSQRQQLILHAVKEKATSLNLVANAGTVNSLLSILGDHFHTNISPSELYRLYNLTRAYPRENILSNNLSPETKLICPQILEESGAYVLVPCPGKDKEDVKEFFAASFEVGGQVNYGGAVWLADSTTAKNLYATAERRLNAAGFTVYRVSYQTQPLDQTVVYQTHDQVKGIDHINEILGGKIATVPPQGLNISADKVDFVIILGGALPDVKTNSE